ncbi:hypothetical protein BKA67DRAFT_529696 [Truncatella angustata]|uniref:Uncharacterized protein n=1 Tax=Truncatella angustata TaxID=152316 RepID=A0A9P8UWN7_9PEZI|nr:uncharacterized protein BKA67DRAFT_529696 [Truncatella angustata]KAH6659550.1 hypothetical protein BKA67DRAFT_529696 [Truncatella angustata]
MPRFLVLLLLLAATLTLARAVEQRALTSVTSIANFDRFACSTPNKLGFEVRQNVRTYQVFFGRMYLLEPGLGNGLVPVGVAPSSGRNVAAYIQTTDPFVVPFITIPPGKTNVTSFDVASFNFGCVYGPGAGSAKALSVCIVTVFGYNNGRCVTSQKLTFQPGRTTNAKMTKAQLNSAFKNLDRVEFATTYHSTVKQGGATYIDDVKYTVHER